MEYFIDDKKVDAASFYRQLEVTLQVKNHVVGQLMKGKVVCVGDKSFRIEADNE